MSERGKRSKVISKLLVGTTTLAVVAGLVTAAGSRGHASVSDGQTLYDQYCLGCHGDPTDPTPGQTIKKVPGARSCSIDAAIYGNPQARRDTPYPNGVPDMQWLQGLLTSTQVQDISDYLNSFKVSGQQRYVTACADCHGTDASGGFVGVNVQGARPAAIAEAIADEGAMSFLGCLPISDVIRIGRYLRTLEHLPQPLSKRLR